MCLHIEIESLELGIINFFSNFHTLVISLQVDLIFSNELEIVYKGFYKNEDTSIFAWSSIPSVVHYSWLHDLIHRQLLNNKADYLVHIMRHILDFLQL